MNSPLPRGEGGPLPALSPAGAGRVRGLCIIWPMGRHGLDSQRHRESNLGSCWCESADDLPLIFNEGKHSGLGSSVI